MTRKSYPPIAAGACVTCPACRRDLEITAYTDGEELWLGDASLHATAMPLRDVPCTFFDLPTPWGVRVSRCAAVRGVGAGCNWLGERCNVASHVTPVTPSHVLRHGTVALHVAMFSRGAVLDSCTWVNGACTHDALWLVEGLARCVHREPA